MSNRVGSFTAGLATAIGPVTRQRKCVVFSAVCLAAVVAALIGGVQVAQAATCAPNLYETGYGNSLVPPIGSSLSMQIKIGTATTLRSGSIASWMQVEGYESIPMQTWIMRIGLRNTGSGWQVYIWYGTPTSGTVEGSWSATKGTYYNVSISHDATEFGLEEVTAHYGSHSYSNWVGNTGFVGDYFTDTTNTGSTCNTVDSYFNNIAPYGLSGMNPVEASPYSLTQLSNTEFETTGG